jgi:hypothetical protein
MALLQTRQSRTKVAFYPVLDNANSRAQIPTRYGFFVIIWRGIGGPFDGIRRRSGPSRSIMAFGLIGSL